MLGHRAIGHGGASVTVGYQSQVMLGFCCGGASVMVGA